MDAWRGAGPGRLVAEGVERWKGGDHEESQRSHAVQDLKGVGAEACRRPTGGRCECTRIAQLRLRDLPAASRKPGTPGAACCPSAGPDVALGQLAVGSRQLARSWPQFSAQIWIIS